MALFIIDENLPYLFDLWKGEDYIHVYDMSNISTDDEIWKYAMEKNMTIVTKDADFSNRILFKTPPPKVIHIKLGNMKISQMYECLNKTWNMAKEEIKTQKLVNIYSDRIETIGNN
ncbi:MAG: DUF5615 family PIN-like protein [Bacteroidota bacterium]